MKKYLFALLFLSCVAVARGQSISLLNLANLTNLTNKQAAEDIASRKVFKLQHGELIDSFLVEHYQTTAPKNKLETIVVGKGYKLATGGVLHTVTYVSADPQNVINLMAQAKSVNLLEGFHGADQYDKIYVFDNSLYRVVVRMSFDQKRSTIDISQKQVLTE